MENLSDDIQNHFRNFFFNEEPVDSFLKWLYTCNEIEQAIGYENYYSLLEIDYRQRDSAYIAKKVVQQIYENNKPGQLVIDQAKSICERILGCSIDLHAGCRKLADLCFSWNNSAGSVFSEYIDSIFVAYTDELDRLDDTDFYDDRIIDEVKKLLSSLKK